MRDLEPLERGWFLAFRQVSGGTDVWAILVLHGEERISFYGARTEVAALARAFVQGYQECCEDHDINLDELAPPDWTAGDGEEGL